MEGQDEELHLKQSYLKSEIIDKNIDQEKFLDYCMKIKENGDDINNWTFDELKKCVADFNELLKQESEQIKEKENQFSSLNSFLSNTNSNSNQNSQMQIQSQQELNQQNQNKFSLKNIPNIISNKFIDIKNNINDAINNNNPNSQNQLMNKTSFTTLNPLQLLMNSEKLRQKINSDIQETSLQYPSFNNLQKREIKCKYAQKTILNDKKIKVTIQNPKNSEKSLLSTQYTLYEIVTKPLNLFVQRRYSDFDWLRNILVKLYPRLFIPPIPGKKTGQRRFEQDFINKRMKLLQLFLDEITENEELKASEALSAFLSFTDRSQFERKMKELNNYIPSQYCEDLKTLD